MKIGHGPICRICRKFDYNHTFTTTVETNSRALKVDFNHLQNDSLS